MGTWKTSRNGYDTVEKFDTYADASAAREPGQKVVYVPADGWEQVADDGYSTEALQVTTDHGVYRARIDRDIEPMEPENESGCPVVRIDTNRGYSFHAEMTGYGSESAAHDGIAWRVADVLDHFRQNTGSGTRETIETFERYLRIFHGGTVAERGPDNYADSTYLAYDTAAMRQWWAGEGGTPTDDPAEMDEWTAYLEGETYGVSVERATSFDEDGDPDGWEEVDGTVWGHYGETWAKQAAEEELSSTIAHEASKRLPVGGE
jgi:hypothetical protein